jgi:hypothetical protein
VAGTGLRANSNLGERVLLGCSPGVAHSLGPDGGSIQFASVNDLTRVWIVAIRLELSRDWSWDGLDYLSIGKGGVEVGQVEPRRTVAAEALGGVPTDHSDVIFFDIFDPKPPPGQFPAELQLTYTVHPVFRTRPPVPTRTCALLCAAARRDDLGFGRAVRVLHLRVADGPRRRLVHRAGQVRPTATGDRRAASRTRAAGLGDPLQVRHRGQRAGRRPGVSGGSLLPYPPVTQLWVLLYAQVHQADDTDIRNLLLDSRQAYILVDRWTKRFAPLRADAGTATWSEAELDHILGLLGLSPDAPLSCVVVETLPGEQPVTDPVSAGLGYERFLRTSPLTAIPVQC